MNPLPIEQQENDKVVIVGQMEIDKNNALIGSKKVIKGHAIFEINVKEQTIEVATFEENLIMYPIGKPTSNGLGVQVNKDGTKKLIMDPLPTKSNTIIKKPGCIYISALNRKNVLKKMQQRGIIKIVKS